jgi:hypothetical protein
MAKDKLPKRMFAGSDRVSSFTEKGERTGGKELKKISQKHQEQIQAIEEAILAVQREEPAVDDHSVDAALQAALLPPGERKPGDAARTKLVEAIEAARSTSAELTDAVWTQVLKALAEEVEHRSDRRPGTRTYLDGIRPHLRGKESAERKLH